MRRLGLALLMASTAGAGAAWADAAYIRLEAWREPAEAAAKAQGWAARFPEIVTWQAGSWIAIGLGPIEGDAKARMAALKAERAIPRDAYLVQLDDEAAISRVVAGAAPMADAGPMAQDAIAATAPADGGDSLAPIAARAVEDDDARNAEPMAGDAEAAPAAEGDTAQAAEPMAGDAASTDAAAATDDAAPEAADAPAPDDTSAEARIAAPAADDVPPPATDTAAAPLTRIRLEAFPSRPEAEAALDRWRAVLPGAGLWQLPDGWHAVATGALDPARADDWLAAWKAAGAIPADAFATTDDQLGTRLAEGAALDLDVPPPVPPVMPPIEVVQEALHWAGRYQGEIDGRPGPQTNAAISAEMQAQGIAADTRNGEAIAMQALLARRDAWQGEMGLAPLADERTGLTLTVPRERLEFLREDRGLSIYGPRDGSGAALILFNQPGGRAEMADLAGLITALGWVGHPVREMEASRFTLDGQNDSHIGHAEGRLVDGHLRGFVLIWPAADAENAPRLAAVASETLVAKLPD